MPRKLGQHFLIRDAILERIAKAACGEHTERAIEIGPGRGALTRHLLPLTDDLHAIEIDNSLVQYLQTAFASETKLHIHSADVLEIDLTQWGPAVIAGNLPYYITSPIIERFLNLDGRFPVGVFLVQWEVAERLSAEPGTRAYGYFTVETRLICDIELVCRVPASAFRPPPNVDSAAIKLVRTSEMHDDMQGLLKFVSRCFAHKRKTLRNNLRPFYGEAADRLPEANLRAEQLTLDQFKDLYNKIKS